MENMQKMETILFPGKDSPYVVYDRTAVHSINGITPDENGDIAIELSEINLENVALKSDVEVLQNSEVNQQLVTDANGNVKWEDKTHYKKDRITLKLSPKYDKASTSSGRKWIGGTESSNPIQIAAAKTIAHELAYWLHQGLYEKWVFYWDGDRCEMQMQKWPILFEPAKRGVPFGLNVKQTGDEFVFEVMYNDDNEHTLEFELAEPELKQLDEDFIPDTIARKSDVERLTEEMADIKEGGAHQVFITDANGKTAWEDRTHYKRDRIAIKVNPAYDKYEDYWQGGVESSDPEQEAAAWAIGDEIKRNNSVGRDWIFYWDGVKYSTNRRRLPFIHEPNTQSTVDWPFGLKISTYGERVRVIVLYDDGKEHTLEWEMLEPELKQLDEDFMPTSVPVIKSARVGQIPYVNAVDDNGKPTEWVAEDVMPTCMFWSDDGISVMCEREIDFNSIELWFAYGFPMSFTNNKTGAIYRPIAFYTPGDGTKRICYDRGGDYYVITADIETKALTLSRTADLDEFHRT